MTQFGEINRSNVDGNHGIAGAPPLIKRDRLSTLVDVRREMSRIYRDMKHGKRPTQDGSRLVFVLTSIAKLIEQSDLEKRIDQLEESLRGRRQ